MSGKPRLNVGRLDLTPHLTELIERGDELLLRREKTWEERPVGTKDAQRDRTKRLLRAGFIPLYDDDDADKLEAAGLNVVQREGFIGMIHKKDLPILNLMRAMGCKKDELRVAGVDRLRSLTRVDFEAARQTVLRVDATLNAIEYGPKADLIFVDETRDFGCDPGLDPED